MKMEATPPKKINKKKVNEKNTKDNPTRYLLSGALSLDRKTMTQTLEDAGVCVVNKIESADVLVCGDLGKKKTTAKVEKAKTLGLKIISEKELNQHMGWVE